MRVAVGSDHAGFVLKKVIVETVTNMEFEVIDFGVFNDNKVDFPDYAEQVALAVLNGKAEKGILLCGSGVGVSIAANKIKGIYAAVCHDCYSAHQGVEHDGMNVLCLGGRVIGPEPAMEITRIFLNARFVGEERFLRRLNKIKAIENRDG